MTETFVEIHKRVWVHSRWWLFWLCAWIPIILLIILFFVLLGRRKRQKAVRLDDEQHSNEYNNNQFDNGYIPPQQPYDQQGGYNNPTNPNIQPPRQADAYNSGMEPITETKYAEPESPPQVHTKE
ncbi:hypothetical protein G210_2032 [Candida maltosa Xu316]|uniref:Uncharacterized protein n=1 Tax=Candida maltosa (strain Xu316) TaxID=1245528 RepID=M3JXA6_CANMX|nr:hypothetical protein G210_2032 [Candida maltosa Xu316]